MKVTLDAEKVMMNYRIAFRKLQALEGFNHRDVLRGEAGVILKTWAGRTKVATQEKVDRSARNLAIRRLGYTRDAEITVNTGVRGPYGRIFLKTKNGKFRRTHEANFKPVSGFRGQGSGDHYPQMKWNDLRDAEQDVKAAVALAIPAARRAIGLSRQSVIQIGDALGIDLAMVKGGGSLSATAIAKARAAIASNGKQYTNGLGTEGGDVARYFVSLVNVYPLNVRLKMDSVLLGVISGRAKYIEKSYEKGAFDSMNRTVKAFPNILRGVGLEVPALTE